MKHIKIFALILALLPILPACDKATEQEQTATTDSINTELTDSLATANAEKDSLMALMNDINEGVTELKRLQDIVTAQDLSAETPDRKQQLRADMELVQRAVKERQQRLLELEKRLAQSNHYTAEMKKTIEGLKTQIGNQQAEIESLKQQLARAHVQIENLNTQVDSLATVNKNVTEEKQQVQQQARQLEDELNTCFYVIGSEKELKANKIIETGFLRKTKILERDFERSYFTKADKRTLKKIKLNSRKYKIFTKHDPNSYEVVDVDGSKEIHILNSKRFWELSNYLVVKIN